MNFAGPDMQIQEWRDRCAEKDRRIAELELTLSKVVRHVEHREDDREVCYDWCPKCAIEGMLNMDHIARAQSAAQDRTIKAE